MDRELEEAIASASAVRFLCSGNMVRSAFAELYARYLGLALPVDSAATRFENDGLYPETRRALLQRAVPLTLVDGFVSRHLASIHEVPPADLLVLGMTVDHLDAWRARHPERGRPFLLGRLLGGAREVADPVLDGAPFDRTFETLARCVRELVRRVGPRSD